MSREDGGGGEEDDEPVGSDGLKRQYSGGEGENEDSENGSDGEHSVERAGRSGDDVKEETDVVNEEETNQVSGSKKSKASRPKRARSSAHGPASGADAADSEADLGRFHCNYCSRDLSRTTRMRCAECVDFDLCLDCFSVGATLQPHKSTHAYRIVELVVRPAFAEGWGADEEERLLEGLELFGVGNWGGVAKLISTKTAKETEIHFIRCYLESPCAPLPDPNSVLPALSEKDMILPGIPEDVDPKTLRVMHLFQEDEIAGWMARRGDFLYEWDNEAEDLLADMDITEEDTQQERELKLRVLEIYGSKLDERERRKQFVKSRSMLQYKQIVQHEKKLAKEERELRERLRVFMRFLSDADSKDFLQSISEERSLRQSIEMLKECRRQGARTLSECQKLGSNNNRNHSEIPIVDVVQQQIAARLKKPSSNTAGQQASGESAGTNSNAAARAIAQFAEKCDEKKTLQDIHFLPGADLLTQVEMELCQQLRVSPQQYLTVKEFLIRESCRVGAVKRKDAKAVKLDSTKINKIYDYLASCGWISTGEISGANLAATADKSPPAIPNGPQGQMHVQPSATMKPNQDQNSV
uniref:Transcriptional adapter n=1 Tax=Timspurckia oligopyrenoides TaxID=708627 RepID=A0A7S1EU36_9RHOD|mmetsp:Transcript_7843/g.14227  ORF Transcript_7843/g.14227 Transcript_7843/m.14227 type:complete len:584 (+) Transcript_7843:65-1816(+)